MISRGISIVSLQLEPEIEVGLEDTDRFKSGTRLAMSKSFFTNEYY